MASTFEEKLEALRKIRERQLAKKAETAAPVAETKATTPQDEEGGVAPVDVDALFCTAHCYERGIHGCSTNLPTALHLYRLAAEQGHAVSQWRMGELLESGLCGQMEPDFREAQKWYTLAAESGNREAQNALALMLEEGQQGVPQDTESALRWHLAAAEQGNALSQFCSASLLSKKGQDEAAMIWLQKSAAQGFGPAERVVADMSEPMPADAPDDMNDLDDLVSVATRVAQQLKNLEDLEADGLLEELLQSCPPVSLDPGALGEIELSEAEDRGD